MRLQLGDIVELPDGRVGTMVYNSLDGVGIKWGKLYLSENDRQQILSGNGGLFSGAPDGYEFAPEAMLREPYPSADTECVGEDYKLIERPEYA